MIAYTINVVGTGEATEKLAKFGPSPGLFRAIGEEGKSFLRAWFYRLDAERANKLGGRRTHFYRDAGDSVRYEISQDNVALVVSKTGLRQRWKGGTIKAVNAKYLTIPARSESYGVRALDFPGDLKFIKFKSGAKALVLDDQRHGVDDASGSYIIKSKKNSRKKNVGVVMYWLVPSVYQAPDPSVIPDNQTLGFVADRAIDAHLKGFQI